MINGLSHSQWITDAIAAAPPAPQLCPFCEQPVTLLTHTPDVCPLAEACQECGATVGEPCLPSCMADTI